MNRTSNPPALIRVKIRDARCETYLSRSNYIVETKDGGGDSLLSMIGSSHVASLDRDVYGPTPFGFLSLETEHELE